MVRHLRPAGAVGWLLTLAASVSGCAQADEVSSRGAATATAVPTDGPRATLRVYEPATGEVRWERDLGGWEFTVRPVLGPGVVLVAGPGREMTAYDAADGHARWVADGASRAPAISGDLAVFELCNRLEARDLRNGEIRWSREIDGELVPGRAAESLVVLRGGLGEPATCQPADAPMAAAPGAPVRGAPGTAPESLGPSTVTGLEPATGETRWSVEVPGAAQALGAAATERIVAAAYYTDTDSNGAVRGLRLRDGSTAWTRPALSPSAGAAADVIAVESDQGEDSTAQVVDAETGRPLWSVPADGYYPAGFPFLDGRGGPEVFEAFRRDPRTGAEQPGTVPFRVSTAVGADGELLVGADAGTLTARRGSDLAWTAPLPPGPRPSTEVAVTNTAIATVTVVNAPVYGD